MKYVGTELDVFKHALNWKKYWGAKLAPHVFGEVCEVGAGIGGSTAFLSSTRASSWTMIEPDPTLAARLHNHHVTELENTPREIFCGKLNDLPAQATFDTITYIDVLEHIENDNLEVAEAYSRLRPGGVIIALSPASMCLYSEFDKAVGHWRRYSLNEFQHLFIGHGTIIDSGCLDLPGAVLSLANRLMLRQANPNPEQIAFWDRWIIPIARVIDPMPGIKFGRSVYVVVRKPENAVWQSSQHS